MVLRLDEAARTLTLGVADFLSDDEFFRIGFDRGDGLKRLWVGQAIHGRYQDQRMAEEPTYRREVPFVFALESEGWAVRILGRIDGLHRGKGGSWVVEEVKSTSFALDGDGSGSAPRRKLDRARRQLLLYCHAIAHQGGPEPAPAPGPRPLAEVSGQLVFVDIASGAIRRLPVEYDPAPVSEEIRGRVAEIVRSAAASRRAAQRRAAAADSLPFPHALPRPGQPELSQAVERAFDEKEILLVSAPTGVGKTAAALHPALRRALETNRKLFVLTAKTLQQPLALSTIERMAGGPWNAVRLRAREKMCANGRVVCHEELCRFAKEYPDKMSGSGLVDRLLAIGPVLDSTVIYDESVATEVCPFEVSLELASRAQVVVADYNYVFDPDVALRDVREPEALGRAFLVVDEAHNLVDRAREIYSPSLSGEAIERARQFSALRSADFFEAIARELGHLERTLADTADSALGEGNDGEGRAEPPGEELAALRERFEAHVADYLAWKRETLSYEEKDPLLDLFFALVGVTRLLPEVGDDLVPVVARREGVTTLRLVCLDPARFLGPIWREVAGAVLMSATLRPFEFYEDLLGLPPERTGRIVLESPFPPENRRVVIIPTVSTSWKHRDRDATPTAELLGELARAVPGNVLALFPSYRFLADVVDRIPAIPQRVLRQRADLTETEREELLRALTEAPPSGIFLAAVSGGLYAEGVDYPGEILRAVFVVSPALPLVSYEQKMLEAYYEERYGKGFDYAYVIPGLRRVVQSAGRVVRSGTDRGLVALVCRRFAEERFRRYLPPEWFAEGSAVSLPPARAARVAREFFLEANRSADENSVTEKDRAVPRSSGRRRS
jgi:DNA excision repair protein ERCC-2